MTAAAQQEQHFISKQATSTSDNPSQSEATPKMYAITITGIQLKNIFCYPAFYWYAVAALNAAQSSPGNIHASTNQYNLPNDVGQVRDTLMTLTVWEDRASTLQYVYKSPAHIAAMKQVKNLSNYSKTHHYESMTIPTWEEAKEIWLANGKEYNYNKTNRKEVHDAVENISTVVATDVRQERERP